jgi:hypothetical protein
MLISNVHNEYFRNRHFHDLREFARFFLYTPLEKLPGHPVTPDIAHITRGFINLNDIPL